MSLCACDDDGGGATADAAGPGASDVGRLDVGTPASDAVLNSPDTALDALDVALDTLDGSPASVDALPNDPDVSTSVPDTAQSAPDAAAQTPDSAPTPPDAAPIRPDAIPEQPDAEPVPWPADRPPGQCVRNGDCPSGACQRDVPGGICSAGGGCPPGSRDSMTGACNRPCEVDHECPVGLICRHGFGGDMWCGLDGCDGDDNECEGPYVCTDGFCRRPACAPDCPAPLHCVDGRCVEP